MENATDAKLVRAIRRWDLVAVAVNSIIGAGIFGLPKDIFAKIGPYSLIAFVACAAVVTLIVLCFAEVSSRFSGTGGPYLYAHAAFGPLAGFEVGWLLWIARITAYAANLNLLVGYLSFFWPQVADPFWQSSISLAGHVLTLSGRTLVITFVTAGLTAVNFVGVRDAALVSNVSTIAKLAPIALFIIVGLFFIDPHAYALGPRPGLGDFSSSVLLLVYAFSGFEIAAIPAGEVRDPRRNLPMALLTALAVVAVVYILIQVVCVGTLPELAQSNRPLADASGRFMGGAGAVIISVGALVSIVGNLNVLILAGTRLPFAMAEGGELPSKLGETHPRFRTPHISILVTTTVMLVATLSGTFVYAATISVIARLLTYMATCAALPVLRRKADVEPALFKLRGALAIYGAALLLSGWLLYNTTSEQRGDSAKAAGIGLVIYFAYGLKKKLSRGRQ